MQQNKTVTFATPTHLILTNAVKLLYKWAGSIQLQWIRAEPNCQTLYDATWAENHAFGVAKSTVNFLFVSQLEFWIDIVRT